MHPQLWHLNRFYVQWNLVLVISVLHLKLPPRGLCKIWIFLFYFIFFNFRIRCNFECCKTKEGIYSCCFWSWRCWAGCMLWKILFEIFVLFILFVRFGSFLHFNLFLFYFFRLLKVQELLGHQGLLGLTWVPRGMRKVGTLSSFLLIEFLFSMILSLWFSLLLLAKKFGVTEFVNPKDHDRPVQEV